MDYYHYNNHDARNTRKPPRGSTIFIFNRPRNLFIAGIAVGLMASMFKSKSSSPSSNDEGACSNTGKQNLVEAWYNPQSKQYEQPAPWDSFYKQLKPEHQLISRELVRPRRKE
jgi:hypothetical protein